MGVIQKQDQKHQLSITGCFQYTHSIDQSYSFLYGTSGTIILKVLVQLLSTILVGMNNILTMSYTCLMHVLVPGVLVAPTYTDGSIGPIGICVSLLITLYGLLHTCRILVGFLYMILLLVKYFPFSFFSYFQINQFIKPIYITNTFLFWLIVAYSSPSIAIYYYIYLY